MTDSGDKKTVHISEKLHKVIELWKAESDEITTIEEGVERLILKGFKVEKENLPKYILEKLTKFEKGGSQNDESKEE